MPGRRICLVSGSVAFLNSSFWKHQVADLMVYFGSFWMQNNFPFLLLNLVTFWAQRNEEKQKKTTKQMRFPQRQAAGFRARAERDRGRPLSAAACGGLLTRAVTAVTQAASSRGS